MNYLVHYGRKCFLVILLVGDKPFFLHFFFQKIENIIFCKNADNIKGKDSNNLRPFIFY